MHRVALRDLALLEINARYMESAEYRQLVENLKRDGVLSSTPTVARASDAPLTHANDPDALEVLSGNHRVQAAIDAGIEEADVLEIVTPLTRDQKIAVQLSHNRIVGKDDPSVLIELYSNLPLDLQLYSGHSDDDFKLPEIDLESLGIGTPKYEELIFAFLPTDAEAVRGYLSALGKSKRAAVYAADLGAFTQFFETVIAVKEHRNIHNSAIAVRVLCELASERMQQLEADGAVLAT